MILCIDMGNYWIKTSNEEMFSSRFIISKDGEHTPIGEDVLEYDGMTCIMEKGEYDNEFNKSLKNYIPNLLFAIHKSISAREKAVELCLGVPLSTLGIKEKFKEDLSNKTFTFKVNGKERTICIDKIGIIGEGLSSYYTLSKTEREQDCIIYDFGSRTTNVCSFVNGKADIRFTVNLGTLNLYDNIRASLNANGTNYEITDVERLIKNNLVENLDGLKDDFVNSIMNQVDLKISKEKRKMFVSHATGGGSITLNSAIEKHIPNVKFMTNPLYTNVLGNKKVCEIKWSK
jgi:plasmid segregation protein ParM